MSNEEQVPGDPREEPGHEPGPDAADGSGDMEDAAVLDPDTVVLDEPDISGETLEPELTVAPGSLDLEEPALEPARISPEVAEAASLDDAAAEARAVAAEAEEAGTLVGGPMPPDAPSVKAAPDGTAPAGGTAGDQDDPATGRVDEDGPTAGTTAGHPADGPRAVPPQGGAPGAERLGAHPGSLPRRTGSSAPGASRETPDGDRAPRAGWVPTPPGEPGGEPAGEVHPKRDRARPRSGVLPLALLVGGALLLLGLLVWLLVSLLGGGQDEGRVDPSSLAAGECLAEFTDITEEAVLVDCSEPHNAQLVASENYADDAEFPGRDQLGLRAEAACATASSSIDPDVLTEDLRVTLLHATPTEGTWADGDRRVDCFAVVEDGGPVSRSLLMP
ncbi:septum formation family protein [Arthrobacter sp. Ld5]|uniref:septum formation family protein n=1 Tax=Arthrobacter sp. Ld5 TaxID=649152 RepID=UPI003EBE363E